MVLVDLFSRHLGQLNVLYAVYRYTQMGDQTYLHMEGKQLLETSMVCEFTQFFALYVGKRNLSCLAMH